MPSLTASARLSAAHAAARIFVRAGFSYRSGFRHALARVDGRDMARAYAEEQCHMGRAFLAVWLKTDGTRREMPCILRSDSRAHRLPHLLPVTDLDTGECRFVNLDTLSGFHRIDDPSELPPVAPTPSVLSRIAPDRPAVASGARGRGGSRALFPLGRTLATPAALALARDLGVDVAALLRRHESGDWGDVCATDSGANDLAADPAIAARVLSAYDLPSTGNRPGGRVWVITEADRSATTVLLPSEY